MAEKQKLKIAVVDDHIQTVVNITSFLDNEGFKTVQSYNCDDSVKLSKKENPDLLVIDLKTVCGQFGCNIGKTIPNQKVLFLGEDGLDESNIKGMKDVVGILKKPVDNGELLKMIKKEFKLK